MPIVNFTIFLNYLSENELLLQYFSGNNVSFIPFINFYFPPMFQFCTKFAKKSFKKKQEKTIATISRQKKREILKNDCVILATFYIFTAGTMFFIFLLFVFLEINSRDFQVLFSIVTDKLSLFCANTALWEQERWMIFF